MIRIPVAFSVREPDFDGPAVQTRSVAKILLTTAASIEVPREDVDTDLVEERADFPGTLGSMQPILKIHSSRNAPDRATVAVQHRGCWFYVDDTDLTSKANLSADSDALLHPVLRRPLSIVICCREPAQAFIMVGTAEDMFSGDEPTNVIITTPGQMASSH